MLVLNEWHSNTVGGLFAHPWRIGGFLPGGVLSRLHRWLPVAGTVLRSLFCLQFNGCANGHLLPACPPGAHCCCSRYSQLGVEISAIHLRCSSECVVNRCICSLRFIIRTRVIHTARIRHIQCFSK